MSMYYDTSVYGQGLLSVHLGFSPSDFGAIGIAHRYGVRRES